VSQAEQKSVLIDVDRMNEILEAGDFEWQVYFAAQEYAKAGFYVLPLEGKKLPPAKFGVSYSHASKKMATMEKWFHPTEGKFAGHNIGIATGKHDGVFVMDIDRKGKNDGYVALKELTDQFGPVPDCPIQETVNDGLHYLFQWQDNCISSVNKIAKGIDTRGGHDNRCSGHIVVFPSKVGDKQYKWIQSGSPPPVPPWIMEKMGVAWRAKKPLGTGRGNEDVDDEDVERVVPIEQLQRMLAEIDIEEISYDDWLRIGQAINTQYPGDDGFALWDSWSQSGSRYKPNECSIRWQAFDPSGPVRVGSIYFHAKNHGWEPKKTDVKSNKFDELVEKMNQMYSVCVVGGKVKIVRERKDIVDPALGSYDLIGIEDMKLLHSNDVVFVEDSRGNAKPVSVAKIWLAHEGRRTFENGMGLFPEGDRPGYYNTWKGWAVEPRPGECGLFLEHIRKVICNGNKSHYTWLLDWIADAIQDPANPKGTAVVMRGNEGTGKGTLANTIGLLFGTHYRHLIDDSHLLGNFNAHMMDAMFVFADEITWGGNTKSSGKLKGMVTEKYLIGERKGVDAVTYRSMVRIMIASNSDWVIPAGTNSRRWFIIDVPPEKASDKEYFDRINDELEHGGREAFLHLMMERKITSNLRVAIETDSLQEQRMRSLAADSLFQWWMACIDSALIDCPNEGEFDKDNPDESDWPQVVIKSGLYDAYCRWAKEKNQRIESQQIFYKRMRDFGLGDTRPTGKSRKRCYKIPAIDVAISTLKRKYNIDLENGL
jgi:hypothetical protein